MKMFRSLVAVLALAGLWVQPVAAQNIPKSFLPRICATPVPTATASQVCVNDGNGVEIPIGTLNPFAHTYTPSGTPLGITFGTTAGTVAQGNDSRFVGSLQASNALSELASVSAAARANIGAAARGSNSDITALTGLTTPIATAQGGTGGTSLSGAFDSAFGSVQGSMLYRNAANWVVLLPGSSGQLLTTGGTSASPTWTTVNGSGTVTSVALQVPSDQTVTGSPITGAGTFVISRTAQAANLVLAGPVSGSNAVPTYRALVPADESAAADGCVRLVMTTNTLLTLSPRGCNTLWIGGVPTVVTPITASNTALAVNTTYYVYDTTSGLAVVATNHITAADGREYINNGGVANTAGRLVGMVRTDGSGNFTAVASYFNRGGVNIAVNSFSDGIQQTTPIVMVTSSSLVWDNEITAISIEGNYTANNTGNGSTYLAVDGNAVGYPQACSLPAASTSCPFSIYVPWKGTEGWHTFAAYGGTSSSSVSIAWYGAFFVSTRG